MTSRATNPGREAGLRSLRRTKNPVLPRRNAEATPSPECHSAHRTAGYEAGLQGEGSWFTWREGEAKGGLKRESPGGSTEGGASPRQHTAPPPAQTDLFLQ